MNKSGRVGKDVLSMKMRFGVVIDGKGRGANERDGDERDCYAAEESSNAFFAYD